MDASAISEQAPGTELPFQLEMGTNLWFDVVCFLVEPLAHGLPPHPLQWAFTQRRQHCHGACAHWRGWDIKPWVTRKQTTLNQ